MPLDPPLDAPLTLWTPPGGEAEDDVNRGRTEVEAGGMIPLRTVVTPDQVLGGRLLTITVESGVFHQRHSLGGQLMPFIDIRNFTNMDSFW